MALLFVDKLTAIDCSILDPHRGLIGASWSVNIELGGELDDQSMVFDFSKVKKTIKTIIDSRVDHKLLVPSQHAGLSISGEQQLALEFKSLNGELITHRSPASAICSIDAKQIDMPEVTTFLETIIRSALPANISQLSISLENEKVDGHYYCYSHGLKKHDGNCQRIAHGHRSLVQVWKDQQRDDEIEHWLAQQWQDIYLGSNDDVVRHDEQRIGFRYQSEQGNFELELPSHRVHLMEGDSTVECIAQHILSLVQARHESSELKIKAFEGIEKGAIAYTHKSR